MFIAPQEDESQEEFLARVEQAAKLLGGKSLYSLAKGKKQPEPDKEDDKDVDSGEV
jgi:hypothetical protein